MHSLRAERAGFPEYAGQYRLESVLGSGGMGVVHLATSASGLRLAVKVVHAQHAVDPEFRARFRQEVAAARRVSGAFTAPVVDADPLAERPWMATLFIDAPTLAERVRERPLDGAEAARLGAGLAEALRDIHRAGVVHRDLKPSNVLMAPDGVRVIDFGISRPVDSDLRTETGKLIGTPPFMAPEQFQRPREVGPAADVFAMGAVLVHALTGRGPFDSESHYLVAYQVVHSEPDLTGVPDALAPVLARCLAKDPADRPTPDALLGELRAAAYPTGEDTRAFVPQPRRPLSAGARTGPAAAADALTHRRVRPPAPVKAPGRRPRRTAVALALGLLLTGGAVGAYAHFAAGQASGGRGAAQQIGPAAGTQPPAAAPWSASLPDAGPRKAVSSCSWAAAALYCSAPGLVAARLEEADGGVTWSVRTPGTGPRTAGATTVVPVASGGLVLAMGPGSGLLQALDPATGAVRWKKEVAADVRVLASGATVLVATADGNVTALDAKTGGVSWDKRLGRLGSVWFTGQEQPDGGQDLYVSTRADDGASSQISAVDPATGGVRWQLRAPGMLRPVGVAQGSLHLLAGDLQGMTGAVVRVDLGTRAVRRTALSVGQLQAEAAVGPDGVAYLIGMSGALTAVGPEREAWRLETAVASASRPVVADGRLYLMAADGRLIAVDAAAGRLIGQTDPRMGTGQGTYNATVPAPVTGGGRVFASAPDGSVFAVDAANPAGW
ncbi:serine/threonine-protein kinase [Streptomyces sp. NBC_01408]|uniref:serine/threonine-protein kinase n=1 Tax=Streptomyces sp. NBC_01408 TaxID=2903855 RepID=UPI002250FAAD|nr:serine/threonine-protein kinase [Streptomyces sp. NBC_01408]MCX4692637.1 PQQ-binding-like beta-propeller repeat protein [Streptomyces sp. NBC_01408]